jgi:predicted RNA-binding Zn-ribbon protein involved in translation (DUF1610 family)
MRKKRIARVEVQGDGDAAAPGGPVVAAAEAWPDKCDKCGRQMVLVFPERPANNRIVRQYLCPECGRLVTREE